MSEHKGAEHWLNKERGTKTRLSLEQVEEIMIELRDGQSQLFIAAEFNISRGTVRAINEGRYELYRIEGYKYPVVERKPAVEYVKKDDAYPDDYSDPRIR
jgi:hypothetical protein